MTDDSAFPTQLASEFARHRQELSARTLHSLCESGDPRFRIDAAGLSLDFSKNFCNETTLTLFAKAAAQAHMARAVEALMTGAEANPTEHRPALHMALRCAEPPVSVRVPIAETSARLAALVAEVRSGQRRGFSGMPIADVVNIGIGGSDLGPRMAVTALKSLQSGPRVHFVANVDPAELTDTLVGLNPETTLIITASKTFTTLETLSNSRAAREWLTAAAAGLDINPQLIAITASPARARQFGIDDSNIFPMWDWVGGRFSLWSAIGLAIALAVGWDNFQALLRGAAAMDEHYRSAEPTRNMPMLMALLECWYLNYWDAHSIAVLPYSHRLRLFPAFLQQLSMESLGKSTTLSGAPVSGHTGAVIWGEPGTNSQHSFMQLLHQGTRMIPVDFILPLTSDTSLTEQHAHLIANGLSQSRALMVGKTAAEVARELETTGMDAAEIARQIPHRTLPGNRPSNTLVMERVDPATLGALIALYENKVHAQSVLWQINAFDQWGVELGKKIEGQIFPVLGGGDDTGLDASTRYLAQRFKALRGT
ncbi:MAG: glucose-6-phosphate isomerase [Spongiibacteraceae bacterium]